MVSTSNEGLMTEVLANYAALRASPAADPARLLEMLFLAECYRDGEPLADARARYDAASWRGVAKEDIAGRLRAADRWMAEFARERMRMWGAVTH